MSTKKSCSIALLLIPTMLLLACMPLGGQAPPPPTPQPASEGLPAAAASLGNVAGFTAGADAGLAILPWPRTDGPVYAIASDGAGGWYLGGIFRGLADTVSPNLVHVQADGSVNAAWAPDPTGWVWSVVVGDAYLYTCGSDPDSGTSGMISARDRITGALIWSVPTDAAHVYQLCPLLLDRDRLYVGGEFFHIAGQPQPGLAVLDAATGALLPWRSGLDLTDNVAVGALALADGTLYVGGSSGARPGEPGPPTGYVAAVSIERGRATRWNLPATHVVQALALGEALVYVGGRSDNEHAFLLAIDRNNGTVQPWQPEMAVNRGFTVAALLLYEDILYVGGNFPAIAQNGLGLAALDPRDGTAIPWDATIAHDPEAPVPGEVRALAGAGSQIAVGGAFTLQDQPTTQPQP